MTHFLPKLIALSQIRFVLERLIGDNILIVQETIRRVGASTKLPNVILKMNMVSFTIELFHHILFRSQHAVTGYDHFDTFLGLSPPDISILTYTPTLSPTLSTFGAHLCTYSYHIHHPLPLSTLPDLVIPLDYEK